MDTAHRRMENHNVCDCKIVVEISAYVKYNMENVILREGSGNMALIKCSECEEYFEDTLKKCPKCGKEVVKTEVQIGQYYKDIHQIAGDIRFIKNLIIIGLVCGFILGIIGVL